MTFIGRPPKNSSNRHWVSTHLQLIHCNDNIIPVAIPTSTGVAQCGLINSAQKNVHRHNCMWISGPDVLLARQQNGFQWWVKRQMSSSWWVFWCFAGHWRKTVCAVHFGLCFTNMFDEGHQDEWFQNKVWSVKRLCNWYSLPFVVSVRHFGCY